MPSAVEVITQGVALTFVVSSLGAAGLSVTARDVGAHLCSPAFVAHALAINFVAAPALAWGLGRLLTLRPGHALALLILGCAAGAPFLPKVAEMARAPVSVAVSLMILLIAGTMLVLPLALPTLAPGVQVRAIDVAAPLLLSVGLPLAAGMTLRWVWPAIPLGVGRALKRTSDATLVAYFVLVVATNAQPLWSALGSGAILGALLFCVGIGAAAYATAPARADLRAIVTLGSAQRNIAAAVVVAGAFRDQPDVLVMIIVTTVVGLVLLVPAARLLRARAVAPPRSAPARA